MKKFFDIIVCFIFWFVFSCIVCEVSRYFGNQTLISPTVIFDRSWGMACGATGVYLFNYEAIKSYKEKS